MKNLALAALVLASTVLATTAAHAEPVPKQSWGHWDTVELIYPFDQGYAFVFDTDTAKDSTASCNGGRQFYVATSDPNYEEKVRTIVAAFLRGASCQSTGTPPTAVAPTSTDCRSAECRHPGSSAHSKIP